MTNSAGTYSKQRYIYVLIAIYDIRVSFPLDLLLLTLAALYILLSQ